MNIKHDKKFNFYNISATIFLQHFCKPYQRPSSQQELFQITLDYSRFNKTPTYYLKSQYGLLNTQPYMSHLKAKIKRLVFQKNSTK